MPLKNLKPNSTATTVSPAIVPPLAAPPLSASEPRLTARSEITLKETIAAVNQLSQFTIQYLGGTVVTTYWKTTRPDVHSTGTISRQRCRNFSFFPWRDSDLGASLLLKVDQFLNTISWEGNPFDSLTELPHSLIQEDDSVSGTVDLFTLDDFSDLF